MGFPLDSAFGFVENLFTAPVRWGTKAAEDVVLPVLGGATKIIGTGATDLARLSTTVSGGIHDSLSALHPPNSGGLKVAPPSNLPLYLGVGGALALILIVIATRKRAAS